MVFEQYTSPYIERLAAEQTVSQQICLRAISAIRPKHIVPIATDDFVDNLAHDGRVSTEIPPITQDGLYLDPDMFSALTESSGRPARAEFTELPLLAIGREDSRNKVMFGALSLRSFSQQGPRRPISVAVKPYVGPDARQRASHEFAMNEYLTRRGIRCPVQLGLLSSGSNIYSISEFEPQIITLDSLDWPSLSPGQQKEAIRRGLESLASLHAVGVFHGDAEFKNLPLQPERNELWAVDFESTVSLAGQPGRVYDNGGILALVKMDLLTVCKSLVDFGLLDSSATVPEKFQTQYNLVLSQYRSIMISRRNETDFTRKICLLLDVLDDLFLAYIAGDNPQDVIAYHQFSKVG